MLWDRLYRLKQQGVTLVLTTHYMDEAEQLCDRLVVMDGGRIVAEGSPAPADRVSIPRARSPSCASTRTRTPRRRCGSPTSCAATEARARRGAARPSALYVVRRRGRGRACPRRRASTRSSTLVRRSTLEDVFLRLTGRSLVD